MPSLLRQERSGPIATWVLDDPPHNPLSGNMLGELDRAVAGAARDDTLRVVVLRGGGRVFSTGASISEIEAVETAGEGERLAAEGQAVLCRLRGLPVPVLAAIGGLCLGGGLELAMACHLRIASERSKLGLPEVDLGIMPGYGGTQRLPRLVGPGAAALMVLTGGSIGGREAHRLGLVDEVVAPASLEERAHELAVRVATKGRASVAAILRSLRAAETCGLAEGLSLEARCFGALCETEAMREGLRAHRERRKPKLA